MGNLVTYHMLFTAQVVTPLALDEHSGSGLRGNLFQAVWERFCTNKVSAICAACPLHTTCAVSALERLMALENAYGNGASMTMEELWALVEQAKLIKCVEDHTQWADVKSYSNRQKRFTPIGGLIGQATFTGNLVPFREYLIWGELIHVGKSCVKGDGWYRVDV